MRVFLPLVLALRGVVADLSSDTLNAVVLNMNKSSTSSWELGTASEAVAEYSYDSISVFASSPAFAPASSLSSSSVDNVLYYARTALKQKNGTMEIMKDSAAGDPASLGMSVVLGNLTDNGDTGVSGLSFSQAAYDEVQYLLTTVPRASNGAISHRSTEVALWADFIYMVPPFLAYYGVVTQNTSLISTAVNQISLYRDILRDPSTSLWRHVLLSNSFNDYGLWATGNAWAAAGTVRTLATIQNSQFKGNFKNEMKSLTAWAEEIQAAFYNAVDNSTHLPHNYLNETGSFYDAASATLMASSVYRLAVLQGSYSSLPDAETYYSALSNGTSSSSSLGNNTVGIDSSGWLSPVVNPLSFSSSGSQSPEGQSFVLLLEAARKDWQSAGAKGKNGTKGAAGRSAVVGGTSLLSSLVLGAAVVVGAGMV